MFADNSVYILIVDLPAPFGPLLEGAVEIGIDWLSVGQTQHIGANFVADGSGALNFNGRAFRATETHIQHPLPEGANGLASSAAAAVSGQQPTAGCIVVGNLLCIAITKSVEQSRRWLAEWRLAPVWVCRLSSFASCRRRPFLVSWACFLRYPGRGRFIDSDRIAGEALCKRCVWRCGAFLLAELALLVAFLAMERARR